MDECVLHICSIPSSICWNLLTIGLCDIFEFHIAQTDLFDPVKKRRRLVLHELKSTGYFHSCPTKHHTVVSVNSLGILKGIKTNLTTMPDTESHFMYIRNHIRCETALSHRVRYITSSTTLGIWIYVVLIIMQISYICQNDYLWKQLMAIFGVTLLIFNGIALPGTEKFVSLNWF